MKTFITFGAGGKSYVEAGDRLVQQAKSTGFFDQTIPYGVEDLKRDRCFWDKHSDFILKNKRGFGYWLWKPYIIKKTMDTMSDGDILLYLDCGCEIGDGKLRGARSWQHGDNSPSNMLDFFEYVESDKIIGTYTCVEKEWCKMDLLMHFDMQDDSSIDDRQHQAGAIMLHVCEKTKWLVNLWYDTACDHHLIDSSPSVNPNLSCFKEHRWDQSIFSLITKKYKIFSEKSLTSRGGKPGCIHYARNRGGNSRLVK